MGEGLAAYYGDSVPHSLYGSSKLRTPYADEDKFFVENPTVGGMMTDDGKVVLNKYSKLSPNEKGYVYNNELSRLMMKDNPPAFELTPEQVKMLEGTAYKNAKDSDRKSTIAARLLTGDPSAGNSTQEQSKFVEGLASKLKGDLWVKD